MPRTSPGPFAVAIAICMTLGPIWTGDARADEKSKDDAKIGLGVRMRYVHVPSQAIELFVERSGGSGSHPGFGVEFIREKGDMAFTVGLEYESIAPRDGVYIDKGDTIPEDPVDYVEFEDFTWVTLDFSFIGQQRLGTDFLALRYGAGLGIGYIMGDMLRTDYLCSNDQVESCSKDPAAVDDQAPEEDIPPVFPVLNVLVGLQLRPFDNVAINIDGGIRTVPFVGTSVSLLF
ncbi:MAG TPA: hypothetical protein VNM90_25730 [Haliangium sp.]|nr:hypothetical protein [Haliangium sp.]